jgi:hypothetical protein
MNTSQPYLDEDSDCRTRWGNVHEAKIFKCVLQYTKYSFKMSYRPRQSANRWKRGFLHPFLREDSIGPQNDVGGYKVTVACHSLGSLLRRFPRGKIEQQKILITCSDLSEARLVNSSMSYPLADLKTEIQNLFEDISPFSARGI